MSESSWTVLILFIIAGIFIAPPYKYTAEELAGKHDNSGFAKFVLWPARAYANWSECGTISYCRKVRCDAVKGGCSDVLMPSQRPIEALMPKPSIVSETPLGTYPFLLPEFNGSRAAAAIDDQVKLD
ncbi:MAG: hypothetical protein AAGF59_03140 [Pseudomonadota bacterium]